jgi:hypothetical protein
MSTIRSGNTETTGLVYQSDTTGNLVFETLGTTAVTISTDQNVTIANALAVSGNISSSSTGFMQMPVGNTAQRPGTPAAGMFRMNTTTGNPEWYDTVTGNWIKFSDAKYEVDYIVVAGGGSGGSDRGGGGGAGGYISGSITIFSGSLYTVTVGAGGSGGVNTYADGNNSVFDSVTAIKGGGGGSPYASTYPNKPNGGNGGSGGGGSSSSPGTGGSGTAGQGNAGGTGAGASSSAGGGGGAGAAGANASGGNGGNGGAGLSDTWTGSSRTLAGGGGGATGPGSSAGSGGAGGGGNGSRGDSNANASNASANTGGGGGGATGGGSAASGSGGSGIVIIRYLGAQRGSGGTVTSAGGYTIHTFTTSGTFTA